MQVRNMKPLLCLALILASPLLRAEEDVVGRAMHDEMQRSMQKLRLEQLDKPYFISWSTTSRKKSRPRWEACSRALRATRAP